jgi:kumamolisin
MTDRSTYVPLPGSVPPSHGVATLAESGDLSGSVEVTVYLRPKGDHAPEPSTGEPFLSREELAESRGAAPADVSAVEDFARAHGLTVVEVDPAGRRVRLSGTAPEISEAFGVEFQRYEHPERDYRSHAGPVMVPGELSDTVVAVLGLDDRPQAETRFRLSTNPSTSFTPVEVGALYGVSATSSAMGVCVALIELGGGYTTTDLETYFRGLGLATPSVTAVAVNGGSNAPTGSTSGPDTEVMLDIEVVGAIAQGATIAVYFAPNTDQGFADAISAAVHDDTHKPHIISISWGGPENSYTAQATSVFEAAFSDAAAVGVTVFVAAGDSGSSDGATDGDAHVDYPASSPQVVGCGGTHVDASDGVITAEIVWDDLPSGGATGGGVSATFALPSWQTSAGVPPSANAGAKSGRGVPDVAANADPDSGYQIRADGDDLVVGGTSAVAPLYAALAALTVAKGGQSLGFITARLYTLGGMSFRDITSGTNGAYRAGVGWDPCTGLGSPHAPALLSSLAAPATP